jgi:hypothetical protein
MKTFSVRLLILSAIVILSSCASVGPDYRQPETQLPLNWQSPLSLLVIPVIYTYVDDILHLVLRRSLPDRQDNLNVTQVVI